MTAKLGDFTVKRVDDDWQVWEVRHKGQKVMDVNADVAKGIYTRRYDPDALADGRLVKVKQKQETR